MRTVRSTRTCGSAIWHVALVAGEARDPGGVSVCGAAIPTPCRGSLVAPPDRRLRCLFSRPHARVALLRRESSEGTLSRARRSLSGPRPPLRPLTRQTSASASHFHPLTAATEGPQEQGPREQQGGVQGPGAETTGRFLRASSPQSRGVSYQAGEESGARLARVGSRSHGVPSGSSASAPSPCAWRWPSPSPLPLPPGGDPSDPTGNVFPSSGEAAIPPMWGLVLAGRFPRREQ